MMDPELSIFLSNENTLGRNNRLLLSILAGVYTSSEGSPSNLDLTLWRRSFSKVYYLKSLSLYTPRS